MKRNYDYKCGNCGHHTALTMTLKEYSEYDLTPVCTKCSGDMFRVYIVNVPKYSQVKGNYGSSYDAHKESVNLLKNGGEEVKHD